MNRSVGNKRIHRIALIISGSLTALAAIAILFITWPQDPNTISSFNECEMAHYPITTLANGNHVCTLPNGATYTAEGG